MSINEFDPSTHQDPVRALTQRIRGLSVGRSLAITNGRVIKSVQVRHGATHARHFAVARKGRTGKGQAYPTAVQAAKAALSKGD